jgi:hypothetical protein
LSGAEDLVPAPATDADGSEDRGAYWVRRFRPRIEGLFARIERWTAKADGDVHWRVVSKDNVLNIYGLSRQARIADPADATRVFSWLLEETRDDRGNIARYEYRGEADEGVDPSAPSEANRFVKDKDGNGSFTATAQRYLHRVWYGNRVPRERNEPAPTDPQAWLFEVEFDYGDLAAGEALDETKGRGLHAQAAPDPAPVRDWPVRPDPFSSYRAGFEVRTYRLCRRVLMFHRFPDELGRDRYLVRSTDFEYERTRASQCLFTSFAEF